MAVDGGELAAHGGVEVAHRIDGDAVWFDIFSPFYSTGATPGEVKKFVALIKARLKWLEGNTFDAQHQPINLLHYPELGGLFPFMALVFTKGASLGFGWGKPVMVSPRSFTRKMTMRTGHMLVAFAGPAKTRTRKSQPSRRPATPAPCVPRVALG